MTLVMVRYIIYRDYRDTPSCENYTGTKAILWYKSFNEIHGKFN